MNMREVEPNDRFIDYIKKKNWYIDINNSTQIKRYFSPDAIKHYGFLVGENQGMNSGRGACPISNRGFADEN